MCSSRVLTVCSVYEAFVEPMVPKMVSCIFFQKFYSFGFTFRFMSLRVSVHFFFLQYRYVSIGITYDPATFFEPVHF